MRPVKKKKQGESIEYINSMNKKVTHTIQAEYNPYKDAKEPLSANIGQYCSYCEEPRGLADLDIEHIEPKSKQGSRYDWENFLLSCNICNSCKKDQDVDLANTHFPHRDNTYLDFIYDESGRVIVNTNLPEEEYKKAENLYNLVKMGRDPFGEEATSARDFRWKSRYEAWNLAKRYVEKYESGKSDLEDILELAKRLGHWSIWFTAFQQHNEIKQALIEQIHGTCAECFDKNNHYEPVIR